MTRRDFETGTGTQPGTLLLTLGIRSIGLLVAFPILFAALIFFALCAPFAFFSAILENKEKPPDELTPVKESFITAFDKIK